MHLKANTAAEFTQMFEKDVLPLLRKQNGQGRFRSLPRTAPKRWRQSVGSERERGQLWRHLSAGDTLLAKVVEGTPKVEAYEVSNSTFHKIAAKN
jgi:hypothetical protein